VLSFQSFSPLSYAAAKNGVKSNTLRILFTFKTKTSYLNLKILKILIKNRVLVGKFKYKPFN